MADLGASQPKEEQTSHIDVTDYSAPLSHSGIEIALLPMFLPQFCPVTPFEMDPSFQKYTKSQNQIQTYLLTELPFFLPSFLCVNTGVFMVFNFLPPF